jgi:hypothetical protein
MGFARLPAILVLISFAAVARGQGLDRPLHGEWDFEPVKLWEIDSVGDESLARPAELRVSSNGMFCFHDFTRHVSYACDPHGDLVARFARQGSQQGNVSRYINCLAGDDEVVIAAMDKLHFFSTKGEFRRSMPNNPFQRFPLLYIDDNELFLAPGALSGLRGSEAQIVRSDTRGGEAAVFARLPVSSSETSGPPGAVVLGLTPQVLMAYDRQSGTVYYGKNSEYTIYAADTDGKTRNTFGLKRARITVTEAAKRAHFESLGVPTETIDRITSGLPEQATYYYRIHADGGLIYVFAVAEFGSRQNSQPIDIFSADGDYLYRGNLDIAGGKYICGSPDNLRIQGERLYAVLEDDDGKRSIAQYRIKLPRAGVQETP